VFNFSERYQRIAFDSLYRKDNDIQQRGGKNYFF